MTPAPAAARISRAGHGCGPKQALFPEGMLVSTGLGNLLASPHTTVSTHPLSTKDRG